MDQVLMNRLLLISDEIKILTDCALTQSASYNNDDKTKACIIVAKLKAMLGKFGHELHTYFNTSQEPDIDEVSTLTSIQLHGEEALVELEVKIESGAISQNEASTSSTCAVLSSKLPKLSLPIFEGNILDWHQFWDQFSSNIDKRNLPDVDKLLYLKSSLTGEAKNTLEGLDATNKNYQIAVTLLKQRYGKESQIIDAHYAALYKIEPAKTSADGRKTLNEIERHLRVLSSMGENVNHNHLRFIIMEKFPADILYDLKMKTSNESVEEIRNKLEVIIAAKEDVAKNTSDIMMSENSTHYTTEALYVNDKQFGHRKNQMIKRGNLSFKQRTEDSRRSKFYPVRKRCIFCQGAHFNDQCHEVKGIEERKAVIKDLCFICLKPKHHGKACSFEVECPHCNQKGIHNRALCPKKFQA
ncbi:uncharacterized protein LOC119190485 [Manduca sexta]|uniref:uncharacterized protein LOC119190485 n=1 Tax=Manduca sexta TaxID=7130 RepID=UPI00188E2FDD|nr:uncharacterized protein LOC119190485 [Manduca sexta]